MKCRLVCSLVLAGVLSSAAFAAEPAGAWKPLFDGKTLQGWHPVGDGHWTVENGAIVGRANKEKLYGLLVSDRTFKDFSLRFKFKVLDGDSGFYIRTLIKPPEKANGLQIQVGKAGSGVGGIYESYGRRWLVKPKLEDEPRYTKDGQWNTMTIDAHGGHVVVTVNGEKTAELTNDPSRPEGVFAMQMHSGCVMHVSFKDIEIRD
jgi:hypothetical protein